VPRHNASWRVRFRERYGDLEARCAKPIARFGALAGGADRHCGYNRALNLLNDTFYTANLVRRLAVVQPAARLTDLLEKLSVTG
jgi:hypothetical protein